MTKAPSKQLKQLEFPLMVDVNAKSQPPRTHREPESTLKSKTFGVGGASQLKASAEDLTIYRSISEGFLKQFK